MTLDPEPSPALHDAPPATGRRTSLRRAVGVAWLVVLVVALVLALRSRWAEVSDELATLDTWRLVASLAAGMIGVGLSSGIWHAMLLGIGERLTLPVSLRIFFVGQVGKYLPGAVWPAVTQTALGRTQGVAPRASVAAVTLFLWVHIVTAAIVGVAVLTTVGDLPPVAYALLPVLLVLLAPAALRWSLQRLLRAARRAPLRRLPDGRHLLAACGWAALMWTCYGVHLHLLTSAVGQPIGLWRAAGVFAAGWLIGFVLLVAPAGVGPREAAIVALLPMGAAAGLLVALVSRLILTVADAVWAALTALDLRRLRRVEGGEAGVERS